MTQMRATDCRSCGARIVLLATASGRHMPVDAETVTEGDEVYEPSAGHVAHGASCPEAKAMVLRDIGERLEMALPEGWGVCLMLFTLGTGGYSSLIANIDRPSLIASVREILDTLEAKGP